MTPASRSRLRLWVAWSVVAIVAGAGSLFLAGRWLGGSAPPRDPAGATPTAGDARPPASGPAGPSRLRDGARQIGDPGTGYVVAREALARVDAELAAAQDPAVIQRLERKRELIRQAIGRLDGAPGD